MKVEKKAKAKVRKYCVDWVAYGTLYFRWFHDVNSALDFKLELIFGEEQIPQHRISIWEKA